MGLGTGATAAIIGGIGAAGSIASSAIGANAAGNAANEQANSAQNALNFQKQIYGTEQANAQPYINAGTADLGTLQSDLPSLTQGFDPTSAGLAPQFSYNASNFQQDPGYAFALQQGQQAIERSAAAKGGDVSGGTLKSLDAYTTGMADQDYGNAYNRALGTYQQNYGNAFNTYETNQANTFNRLGSLVNTGMQANSQMNQAGQNFANQSGQFSLDQGNAQAAGTIGTAAAVNQGISGATGAATSSLLLNQLLGANGTANTASGYGPYTAPPTASVSPTQWNAYNQGSIPVNGPAVPGYDYSNLQTGI